MILFAASIVALVIIVVFFMGVAAFLLENWKWVLGTLYATIALVLVFTSPPVGITMLAIPTVICIAFLVLRHKVEQVDKEDQQKAAASQEERKQREAGLAREEKTERDRLAAEKAEAEAKSEADWESLKENNIPQMRAALENRDLQAFTHYWFFSFSFKGDNTAQALRIIEVAMNDEDEVSRLFAVRALSWVGANSTIVHKGNLLLQQRLRDETERKFIQIAALDSLAGYDPDAPDGYVPFDFGYARLFDDETARTVVDYLKHKDSDMRAAACRAIMCQDANESRPVAEAVPILLTLINDSNLKVRQTAIAALGGMRELTALRPLQRIAADVSQDKDTRSAAESAIDSIKRFGVS